MDPLPPEGRRPRVEDALAPWVAALNPTYAYWSSSGMETGLETCLLGLSGALLPRELRTVGSSHVGWARTQPPSSAPWREPLS